MAERSVQMPSAEQASSQSTNAAPTAPPTTAPPSYEEVMRMDLPPSYDETMALDAVPPYPPPSYEEVVGLYVAEQPAEGPNGEPPAYDAVRPEDYTVAVAPYFDDDDEDDDYSSSYDIDNFDIGTLMEIEALWPRRPWLGPLPEVDESDDERPDWADAPIPDEPWRAEHWDSFGDGTVESSSRADEPMPDAPEPPRVCDAESEEHSAEQDDDDDNDDNDDDDSDDSLFNEPRRNGFEAERAPWMQNLPDRSAVRNSRDSSLPPPTPELKGQSNRDDIPDFDLDKGS